MLDDVLAPLLRFEIRDLETLKNFRMMLNRAMNCWEPAVQPKWLQELSDRVDAALLKEGVTV